MNVSKGFRAILLSGLFTVSISSLSPWAISSAQNKKNTLENDSESYDGFFDGFIAGVISSGAILSTIPILLSDEPDPTKAAKVLAILGGASYFTNQMVRPSNADNFLRDFTFLVLIVMLAQPGAEHESMPPPPYTSEEESADSDTSESGCSVKSSEGGRVLRRIYEYGSDQDGFI